MECRRVYNGNTRVKYLNIVSTWVNVFSYFPPLRSLLVLPIWKHTSYQAFTLKVSPPSFRWCSEFLSVVSRSSCQWNTNGNTETLSEPLFSFLFIFLACWPWEHTVTGGLRWCGLQEPFSDSWLTDWPVKRDGQVTGWTFQINGPGNSHERKYAVGEVIILDLWLKYSMGPL